MTKSTPSENILKLRELTEKMCEIPHDKDYEDIIKKLKLTVDEGREEVKVSPNPQTKVKFYEKMCSTIITILNTIQL